MPTITQILDNHIRLFLLGFSSIFFSIIILVLSFVIVLSVKLYLGYWIIVWPFMRWRAQAKARSSNAPLQWCTLYASSSTVYIWFQSWSAQVFQLNGMLCWWFHPLCSWSWLAWSLGYRRLQKSSIVWEVWQWSVARPAASPIVANTMGAAGLDSVVHRAFSAGHIRCLTWGTSFSLSSSRLRRTYLRLAAEVLRLPTTAGVEETWQLIEG